MNLILSLVDIGGYSLSVLANVILYLTSRLRADGERLGRQDGGDPRACGKLCRWTAALLIPVGNVPVLRWRAVIFRSPDFDDVEVKPK